jgi:hypothetical protein
MGSSDEAAYVCYTPCDPNAPGTADKGRESVAGRSGGRWRC